MVGQSYSPSGGCLDSDQESMTERYERNDN